ncbi:MAG: hypothetical protein HQL27_03180 [Candidatus Omnitrophica bacterium]|nr:hypothetical protein [Candidatus Omnitrophota bacterium]
MNSPIKKFFSWVILASFLANTLIPAGKVYAQDIALLPQPGVMVNLTPAFTPPIAKGLTVDPQNISKFNFIVDSGSGELSAEEFKKESEKLIKYFLASLTIPEDEMWVNLSPYEKDRIIPKSFGNTLMGEDLLAEDYILKQLSASLVYPEGETGKKFWEKVYSEVYAKYGLTSIPPDIFSRVWIVPQEALVYENGNTAFVLRSKLKVMMDSEYAQEKNRKASAESLALSRERDIKNIHLIAEPLRQGLERITSEQTELVADLVREIIIPTIEKEVNEGKNFSVLRQIYNSMILATWYKRNLKQSLLGKIYFDRKKTKGIETKEENSAEKIYDRYIQALQKGVYNYIKEDYEPGSKEIIPRKYFSGGVRLQGGQAVVSFFDNLGDPAIRAEVENAVDNPVGDHRDVAFEVEELSAVSGNLLLPELARTHLTESPSVKNITGKGSDNEARDPAILGQQRPRSDAEIFPDSAEYVAPDDFLLTLLEKLEEPGISLRLIIPAVNNPFDYEKFISYGFTEGSADKDSEHEKLFSLFKSGKVISVEYPPLETASRKLNELIVTFSGQNEGEKFYYHLFLPGSETIVQFISEKQREILFHPRNISDHKWLSAHFGGKKEPVFQSLQNMLGKFVILGRNSLYLHDIIAKNKLLDQLTGDQKAKDTYAGLILSEDEYRAKVKQELEEKNKESAASRPEDDAVEEERRRKQNEQEKAARLEEKRRKDRDKANSELMIKENIDKYFMPIGEHSYIAKHEIIVALSEVFGTHSLDSDGITTTQWLETVRAYFGKKAEEEPEGIIAKIYYGIFSDNLHPAAKAIAFNFASNLRHLVLLPEEQMFFDPETASLFLCIAAWQETAMALNKYDPRYKNLLTLYKLFNNRFPEFINIINRYNMFPSSNKRAFWQSLIYPPTLDFADLKIMKEKLLQAPVFILENTDGDFFRGYDLLRKAKKDADSRLDKIMEAYRKLLSSRLGEEAKVNDFMLEVDFYRVQADAMNDWLLSLEGAQIEKGPDNINVAFKVMVPDLTPKNIDEILNTGEESDIIENHVLMSMSRMVIMPDGNIKLLNKESVERLMIRDKIVIEAFGWKYRLSENGFIELLGSKEQVQKKFINDVLRDFLIRKLMSIVRAVAHNDGYILVPEVFMTVNFDKRYITHSSAIHEAKIIRESGEIEGYPGNDFIKEQFHSDSIIAWAVVRSLFNGKIDPLLDLPTIEEVLSHDPERPVESKDKDEALLSRNAWKESKTEFAGENGTGKKVEGEEGKWIYVEGDPSAPADPAILSLQKPATFRADKETLEYLQISLEALKEMFNGPEVDSGITSKRIRAKENKPFSLTFSGEKYLEKLFSSPKKKRQEAIESQNTLEELLSADSSDPEFAKKLWEQILRIEEKCNHIIYPLFYQSRARTPKDGVYPLQWKRNSRSHRFEGLEKKIAEMGILKTKGYRSVLEMTQAQADEFTFVYMQDLEKETGALLKLLRTLKSKRIERLTNKLEEELKSGVFNKPEEGKTLSDKQRHLPWDLLFNYLGETSFLLSASQYFKAKGWVKPDIIAEPGVVDLKGSYHPPTTPKKDNPVLNDVQIDRNKSFYALTGPNAAGKSTTERAIGYSVVMAHLGLFVPADSARMSWFNEIHNLYPKKEAVSSSFSHFTNIVDKISRWLKGSSDRSLYILDEPFSGTEYNDLIGLAIVLYEDLIKGGATVITATHIKDAIRYLKEKSDKSISDRVQTWMNGFEIDENNKLVSHYKLVPGIAESSHALAMLRSMDIDDSLIDLAQVYYDFLKDKKPFTQEQIEEITAKIHHYTNPVYDETELPWVEINALFRSENFAFLSYEQWRDNIMRQHGKTRRKDGNYDFDEFPEDEEYSRFYFAGGIQYGYEHFLSQERHDAKGAYSTSFTAIDSLKTAGKEELLRINKLLSELVESYFRQRKMQHIDSYDAAEYRGMGNRVDYILNEIDEFLAKLGLQKFLGFNFKQSYYYDDWEALKEKLGKETVSEDFDRILQSFGGNLQSVDFYIGIALGAIESNLARPQFSEEKGKLKIEKGWYPLTKVPEGQKPTPQDFELTNQLNIFVGPNASGKTNAFRMIQTVVRMANSGFPVPAGSLEISRGFSLNAFFGTSDYNVQGFSYFQNVMWTIYLMFGKMEKDDFIVLDEISGSDNLEMTAIQMALLTYLKKIGTTVILNTHLTEGIKELQDIVGVNVYRMDYDFDEQNREFDFKRTISLDPQVNAKSHGLEVATKYGLTEEQYKRAKKLSLEFTASKPKDGAMLSGQFNEEALKQLTLYDRSLFEAIVGGNRAEQEKLLADLQQNGKVYINLNEIGNEEEGRTIYLSLENPINIDGRIIKVLRCKGVRPVLHEDGTPKVYTGERGAVHNINVVGDNGNIYKKPNTLLKPFGSMFENEAKREFEIMQEGLTSSAFNTDYPIGYGVYENLSLGEDGKKLGFVVAGMEGDDFRFHVDTRTRESEMGLDKELMVVRDVKDLDYIRFSKEEQAEIFTQIGQQLRAYHAKGYFHRNPHLGNIGLARLSKGKYKVLLKDLGDSYTGSEIGESQLKDLGYRFLDLARMVFDLAYPYAVPVKGVDETETVMASADWLVEPFISGYFSDMSKDVLSDLIREVETYLSPMYVNFTLGELANEMHVDETNSYYGLLVLFLKKAAEKDRAMLSSLDKVNKKAMTLEEAKGFLGNLRAGDLNTKEVDAAISFVEKTLKSPFYARTEKIVVVGSSMVYLPIIFALLGREVYYVDVDPIPRLKVLKDVISGLLERKGYKDFNLNLTLINDNIGAKSLLSHKYNLPIGGVDLITLADLVGGVPNGNPLEWLENALRLLKPDGLILIDESPTGRDTILKHFKAVFPEARPVSEFISGSAGYNGDHEINRIWQVGPSAERPDERAILGTGDKTQRTGLSQEKAGSNAPNTYKDEAVLIKKEEVGGIDFNPDRLNMQLEKNPAGKFNIIVPEAANLWNIEIDGLVPVIINISPANNLRLLLGLTEKGQELELTSLRN